MSGCSFQTSDRDPPIVAALLQLHAADHAAATSSSGRAGPKLDRPRIDAGVDEEVWNSFVRRWEAFRTGSQISNDVAPVQLLQCASKELADLVLRSSPDVVSSSVDQLLAALREMAVIPVAKGVKRAELLRMHQSNDETFRTFTARVRGKAEVCGFRTDVKCHCERLVNADYTEEVIRDVILAGVRDTDIRREALSTSGLQERSVNDIIAFIENREMASKAVSIRNGDASSSFAATSTFKRQKTPQSKSQVSEKSELAMCPDCGNSYALFRRNQRGSWNRNAYKNCLDCWRSSRKPSNDARAKPSSVTVLAASQISTLRVTKLAHSVFENDHWKESMFRKHPRLQFNLRLEGQPSSVSINSVADSGAQSNLWSYQEYQRAGFVVSDLQPVSSQFCVADRRPLQIVGAFKGIFEGVASDGRVVTCRSLVM